MLFVAVFLLSSDVDAMVMVRNEKKERKKIDTKKYQNGEKIMKIKKNIEI